MYFVITSNTKDLQCCVPAPCNPGGAFTGFRCRSVNAESPGDLPYRPIDETSSEHRVVELL